MNEKREEESESQDTSRYKANHRLITLNTPLKYYRDARGYVIFYLDSDTRLNLWYKAVVRHPVVYELFNK